MWTVKYKPHNDSQAWLTLESYSMKSQALLNAVRISIGYYKVKVFDSKSKLIWSNKN